ncbi:hypothetical protein [Geomicrobium sp. JCM 19039]|uniref:hypothetical protein n=1 Tax=Geomicrobium sp. JCM 19039 TaxID=1460636 RepID=UPI00045F14C9|nr:hypothetical protein [Geomicrobium sp. JCM 19039]GAK14653.1 hypothetical protein JCM19039_4591 [Geomicrobium sp. JCM 19039]
MIAAFMVAASFGAMLVHQRIADIEKWMVLFALLFAGSGYIGLVLSNGYLSWIPNSWLSGLWLTCTVVFITAAIMTYHPYFGYFGKKDIRLWLSMIGLFVLTGALVNVWLSTIITFLLLIVMFGVGLIAGFFIQNHLYVQWARINWLPYVPLLFLVFATAGKLL